MSDTLSKRERSERMKLIRSVDTKPEIVVRKILTGKGLRYRLHSKKLPGRPDIVFTQLMKVVFVHGCFWHRHKRCRLARLPKSKLHYWEPKLEANAKRDSMNQKLLKKLGWDVLVIWECQLLKPAKVADRLDSFMKR